MNSGLSLHERSASVGARAAAHWDASRHGGSARFATGAPRTACIAVALSNRHIWS